MSYGCKLSTETNANTYLAIGVFITVTLTFIQWDIGVGSKIGQWRLTAGYSGKCQRLHCYKLQVHCSFTRQQICNTIGIIITLDADDDEHPNKVSANKTAQVGHRPKSRQLPHLGSSLWVYLQPTFSACLVGKFVRLGEARSCGVRTSLMAGWRIR